MVEVAGTIAQDGDTVTGTDAYTQTKPVLEKTGEALHAAGASFADVVRTRVFMTDIWEAVGRAHGKVFGEIRPMASMLEVKALIEPRLLVEIEATAIISVE